MLRSCLLIGISLSLAAHAEEPTSVHLSPGQVHRLPASAHYESSAPGTAEVFNNGLVAALQPGTARIRATSPNAPAIEYTITIDSKEPPLVDPATLKQYPDNRRFEVDGRRCYGSELNGQRASDPDERKNTRSNRIINPHPLSPEHTLEWPVQPDTEIYDGAGVLLGTVAPDPKVTDRNTPTSKFNFGMSKVLSGRFCLYAFSVLIKPTPDLLKSIDPKELASGTLRTSAWLPVDRVIDKETLLDRANPGKVKLPRLPLEDRRFRITGGDPAAYMTPHGELAIVKAINGPVPSHYLRRPTNTINVIYSVPGFGLGGQGLDSFLLTDTLTFRPAKGAKQFVQPTYYPKGDPKAGQVAPKTMTFLYGAVELKGQEPVYGWVAQEALEPQP